MPTDWENSAWDLFFCRIISKDPYPVDCNKLSVESRIEEHQILITALKEVDDSEAAIYTVCICMFQALFSSTDNQACGSPNSCMSTQWRTCFWSCTRSVCYLPSGPWEQWLPKASNQANLSVHIPVLSFRLCEWSMMQQYWFYCCPGNQLRQRKWCFCIIHIGCNVKNLLWELIN